MDNDEENFDDISKIEGTDENNGIMKKFSISINSHDSNESSGVEIDDGEANDDRDEEEFDIDNDDVSPSKKNVAKHKYKKKRKSDIPCYILTPEDTLKLVCDVFLIIAILYSVLISPLKLARPEAFAPGWRYMDIITDIIFLIDIFVNFFSAYHDKDHVLVISLKKIACVYLTGWFAFDLISGIPFSLFMSDDSESINAGAVTKLAKAPRLYKITK